MNIIGAGDAFIGAYLKGEEAHLLTPEQVEKLMRVAEVQEAIGAIRDTDIGSYLDGVLVKTFDELDLKLWQYLDGLVRRIRWFKLTPRQVLKLIDAYMAKYDVLNIKAGVATVLSGRQVNTIPLGVISELGLLEALGKAEDVAGIARLLEQAGLDRYARILETYPGGKGVEPRLRIEARLDREYYRNLMAVARRIPGRAVLLQAIGMMVDLTNLKAILRTAGGTLGLGSTDYLIGGGYALSLAVMNTLLGLKPRELADRVPYLYQKIANDAVASLEKSQGLTIDEIIDRSQFGLIREKLSNQLMSPVLIVWYLILKEVEIRDLRLIFKFIFDRRPLGGIKNFLVIAA